MVYCIYEMKKYYILYYIILYCVYEVQKYYT